MFYFHKNSSYVFIGSPVLIVHSISGKFMGININSIVRNINILRYSIPTLTVYRNMFMGNSLNMICLKYINTFKETSGSIIIIRNNTVFQLIGYT